MRSQKLILSTLFTFIIISVPISVSSAQIELPPRPVVVTINGIPVNRTTFTDVFEMTAIDITGTYDTPNGRFNIRQCDGCPDTARVFISPGETDDFMGLAGALITAETLSGTNELVIVFSSNDFRPKANGNYTYGAVIDGTFIGSGLGSMLTRASGETDVLNSIGRPPGPGPVDAAQPSLAAARMEFPDELPPGSFPVLFGYFRREIIEGNISCSLFDTGENSIGEVCVPSFTATITLTFVAPGDSVLLHGQGFLMVGNRIQDSLPGGGEAPVQQRLTGLLVTDLVTFDPLIDTIRTIPDTTGCPAGFAGKLLFDARLANKSTSPSLSDLKTRVAALTNGNLQQNADVAPVGAGATLTVPKKDGFSDGILSPGEFVDVPFNICLSGFDPFDFLVNVLGETNGTR